MEFRDAPRPTSGAPRVVVAGTARAALGDVRPLVEAMSASLDVRRIEASAPFRHGLGAMRDALLAITRDGFEVIHLADPRLAPAALLMRGRFAPPVTVDVPSVDSLGGGLRGELVRRALNRLDQGFAFDEAVTLHLRAAAPLLPVAVATAGATLLPEASPAALAATALALRGVDPLRPLLVMPWPDDVGDLRWFRDVVLPRIVSAPLCLLIGGPTRRQAERVIGGPTHRALFRLLPGRLSGELLAAAARRADLLVATQYRPRPAADDEALLLALAVAGPPLVVAGYAESGVLRHERNALAVAGGDTLGLAEAIDRALALPARQRQYLGIDFARYTLEQWTWDDAAALHAARFASLVSRPQIPANLLAA